MALTSVSNNTAGTLSQTGQQKAADSTNSKEKNTSLNEDNRGGAKTGDTVTLRQAEKSNAAPANIDENQVGDVLPRTKAAILGNSKSAVASQANVNAQTAREILSEA